MQKGAIKRVVLGYFGKGVVKPKKGDWETLGGEIGWKTLYME